METLLQVWKTELCVLLMLLTIILGRNLNMCINILFAWKLHFLSFTTNLCYIWGSWRREPLDFGPHVFSITSYFIFSSVWHCILSEHRQYCPWLAPNSITLIPVVMNLRFRTTLCFYKSCSYTSRLCFSPVFCLWFDISFGGIHSPTPLARQTWLTTAGGQRAVFSPRESKSPPRSTVPKSLTQKTGSYVFGSGGVLQKRFPTDVRESQLMVPWNFFPRENRKQHLSDQFYILHKLTSAQSKKAKPGEPWASASAAVTMAVGPGCLLETFRDVL